MSYVDYFVLLAERALTALGDLGFDALDVGLHLLTRTLAAREQVAHHLLRRLHARRDHLALALDAGR